MSRHIREFVNTPYMHVITQGINKSYIFEYPEDIKYYISTMYKLNQEHEIEIIAYCIMNNHAHLLVKSEKSAELSKYMQRLNTKYGMYYNNKYDRVGYVFRDRFKTEGIYNNEHLYNCIKYIYDNPVKAGICKLASEYPYSNYKKIKHSYAKSTYDFLDIVGDNEGKKNTCEKIINNFLHVNKIYLTDLKHNSQKLKELVTILKEEYHISLRYISQEIDINREIIRKIYKS